LRARRVFHLAPADGFDFSQERVVAIDVRPARLHHTDAGIGEVVNAFSRKSGGGTKSASKMANELALRSLQSFGERTRLESLRLKR